MSSSRPPLPSVWLRLILALHPRRFRRRFANEVFQTYEDLQLRDHRQALRFIVDLLRNVSGTHLDELRLARRRRGQPSPERQETPMLEAFASDLRFATRRLLRMPTITFLAAATLALGIGGTTAIFSVINGVLLRPLSAPAPERILEVSESSPSSQGNPLSYDNFRDYQTQTRAFESLAALRSQSVAVTGGDEAPERIRGLFVSASFFGVLGEQPKLGRAIQAGEDVPGGERTAVISHGFWQRRFAGRENVLGRTLKLNNETHTVVGVMGQDFRFPLDTTEAWISLQTSPGTLDRANRNLFTVGRLADGVTAREASEELAAIAHRLAEAHPEVNGGFTAQAAPILDRFTGGRLRQLFGILAAAVAMVLLIAAANVANLQLAQATGRVREMALRSAVGAHRRRLLFQLLTESLLLALAGGALGITVAYGGVSLLSRFGPSWIVDTYAIEPDLRVLGFALAVSLGTGLIFGIVPARRASRVDLIEGLQDGSRGAGQGRRGGRLRSSLVVAQLALAVILVTSSGLLMRSITNLGAVDVGFDAEQLLTMQFRLPANKYETDEQVTAFFDQMLEQVAAVPGVSGVASALGMPFTGDEGQVPVLADGVDPGPDATLPRLRANVVSPNYFDVMGIPLRLGRTFGGGDRAGSVPVAVISERAAEILWNGEPAVGRTFSTRGDDSVYTVVGVVGDIYNRGLRQGVDPMLYVSYQQQPARFATLAARTAGDPHAYSSAIREAIWSLDSDQPLWEIMTQKERIAGWSGSDRFMASLVAVFALVALTLAAVGIGGVIAYSVALRRRELGVRISLGANRRQIVQLVVGQGLRLVAAGIVLGMTGAVALRGALSSWLYGVSSFDLTIFAAPLILAAIAVASTLGPAWRAAWLDPIHALRDE